MIGYSDFETDTEATTGSDTRTEAATEQQLQLVLVLPKLWKLVA